jgi:hypothetical protein
VTRTSKKLQKTIEAANRLSYPEDEARFDWLSVLLDAYHVIDAGTALELRDEERRRGAGVACHRGCDNCCLRTVVPLNPLEVQGICWYASEKLAGAVRQAVQEQLRSHRQTPRCPFLVDSVCAVYALRPHACRLLHVFGRPCGPEEEVELTRPGDVWTHSSEVARLAATLVLPHFGVSGRREMEDAFEAGLLFDISRPLHEFPWEQLLDRAG